MKMKADLSIAQIEEPIGRYCSSGHIPPETFTIDGYTGPTRFFNVSNTDFSRPVCELCLIVSNYLAAQKKKDQ